MATFDQLPAEQRAIIELVVTRGRSYDALSEVLQVPAARVRELARDALDELSPVSGRRVDSQWRAQIADYVLVQQSGAESTATQAHLKRSEAGRAWALSLLDSLDTLFSGSERPEIPIADGTGAAAEAADVERPRERERQRAGRARPVPEPEPAAKPIAKEPSGDRDRAPASDRDRDLEPVADGRALSPAAQSALRRRRLIGGGIGLAVLAAVVVGILAIAGVFGGSDKGSSKASSGTSTTATTAQAQPQVLGQIPMQAIGGAKAQGVAYILKQGTKLVLAVTAKLPPLPSTQRKAAYNVWLYNSPKDSQSIGAQFTDAQGNYQGVGTLPSNYQRYKSIDVSIQPFNNKTAHSGNSVLRGQLANIQPVQQGQAGGGTTTTPGATAPGGTGTAPGTTTPTP